MSWQNLKYWILTLGLAVVFLAMGVAIIIFLFFLPLFELLNQARG